MIKANQFGLESTYVSLSTAYSIYSSDNVYTKSISAFNMPLSLCIPPASLAAIPYFNPNLCGHGKDRSRG